MAARGVAVAHPVPARSRPRPAPRRPLRHRLRLLRPPQPATLTEALADVRELLVARPVRTPHGRRISITDIWVDSPASVAGGRELWAIPKQLAEIDRETARDGPVGTTAWTARVDGRPVAAARFHDVTRRAPRLPYRAGLWHEGLPDTGGEERVATMRGAAGITPTRARWTFAPTGALGWLARARQLGSLRLADFRMDFG